MTTLEQIRTDFDQARRDRNTVISSLLGTVLGECNNAASRGKAARTLTEAEVIAIVQTTSKNIDQTMALIKDDPARADQHTKLSAESASLMRYLPVQLTSEELRQIAIRHDTLGFNLGKIMAHLKSTYPGRYDAREAADIIKDVLVKGDVLEKGVD